MNLINSEVRVYGRVSVYVGKYYELYTPQLINGKYYQAFIVFRTKEMIELGSRPTFDEIKSLDIKGRVFLSSAIKYTIEGFDNYKKQGPTLKGYEYSNILIPKDYHKIE